MVSISDLLPFLILGHSLYQQHDPCSSKERLLLSHFLHLLHQYLKFSRYFLNPLPTLLNTTNDLMLCVTRKTEHLFHGQGFLNTSLAMSLYHLALQSEEYPSMNPLIQQALTMGSALREV